MANGLEAVSALEFTNYDLVFMDCMMPKMNGFEATIMIRSEGSKVLNHFVPIIALTANALNQDREECLQAGMDDYLTKPIKTDDLAAALDNWLWSSPDALQAQQRQQPKPQPLKQPAPRLFEEAELMAYLNGDLNYAKKVLNYVLTKFPEQIALLRKLAGEGAAESVHQQATKITGMASCTYTPPLQEICYNVEAAAQSGDLTSVIALLPELEQTTQITLKEIQSVVTRISK